MNYEAVLAGLPDAVIAVDATLRVVFWNAAAEVLTARSVRRAQGRLVKEVFAPNTSLVSRLAETREIAQHDQRAFDGAVVAVERGGEQAHRHRPPVGALQDAVRFRPALAGGQGLGEPADQRRVGREHFLHEPALGPPRRARGQHLRRRVPEHHVQRRVDRDHRVG
jgi:PAS domain-containing protein